MKETDSRGKACVVPVAVAAGLGMAGMGLVSDGIVTADTTSVTDTISVTVQPSCTFNSVEDKTYTGSATNGTEVSNFTESGIHEFNLFCNDNNGFIVSATAYDLGATGIQDVIAYTDNYTHTGVNSMWTAAIASETETPVVTVVPTVPAGGGTIISSNSHTTAAGVTFTATYSAYVGTETPAGTYTGTIEYTLAAAGASNSNNSGGNGGDSGTDSSSEVTDEPGNDNSGNGGDSGTGGETTDNSGSGDANSGGSEPEINNAPSAAPLAMNSTYNTYSTTNTYNTTNYSGGSGTGTTGTQAVTSGNTSSTTNGATNGNGNNGSSTEANDDYEQPLGVTTSTSSSSDKNSGIDPMPMVVAGTLAVAGTVGAIALARSNKEEE